MQRDISTFAGPAAAMSRRSLVLSTFELSICYCAAHAEAGLLVSCKGANAGGRAGGWAGVTYVRRAPFRALEGVASYPSRHRKLTLVAGHEHVAAPREIKTEMKTWRIGGHGDGGEGWSIRLHKQASSFHLAVRLTPSPSAPPRAFHARISPIAALLVLTLQGPRTRALRAALSPKCTGWGRREEGRAATQRCPAYLLVRRNGARERSGEEEEGLTGTDARAQKTHSAHAVTSRCPNCDTRRLERRGGGGCGGGGERGARLYRLCTWHRACRCPEVDGTAAETGPRREGGERREEDDKSLPSGRAHEGGEDLEWDGRSRVGGARGGDKQQAAPHPMVRALLDRVPVRSAADVQNQSLNHRRVLGFRALDEHTTARRCHEVPPGCGQQFLALLVRDQNMHTSTSRSATAQIKSIIKAQFRF
ncbi:hypothetical protein B0H14DRAFT_3134756 [Mycena olivaceomarginata]|nr:hypothetical protein B0H14DRAFT_3134756 [Mycena olivaceomarginata]